MLTHILLSFSVFSCSHCCLGLLTYRLTSCRTIQPQEWKKELYRPVGLSPLINEDFRRYSRKSPFWPPFDPVWPHISRTRFLLDVRFSLKEAHYWPLLTCKISKKTNENFSRKSGKTPFWPRFDPFLPHIWRTRFLLDSKLGTHLKDHKGPILTEN